MQPDTKDFIKVMIFFITLVISMSIFFIIDNTKEMKEYQIELTNDSVYIYQNNKLIDKGLLDSLNVMLLKDNL